MVGSSPVLHFVKTEHKFTLKKNQVCLFLTLGEEARPAFTVTYRATQLLKEQCWRFLQVLQITLESSGVGRGEGGAKIDTQNGGHENLSPCYFLRGSI